MRKNVIPILDKKNDKMYIIDQHNFESVPNVGLIHYWPLHASPNDLVGGRNWSVNGSEVYGTNRDGIANKAAVFTDNTTYLQLDSDLNIGNVFTVSFWFYGKLSLSDAPMILNKYATSVISYISGSGQIYNFRTSTSSYQLNMGTALFSSDTWYHIVVTRNNSAGYLFKNNTKYTISEAIDSTDNIIRTLNKRYNSTDNLYALNGKLSDVRIYNRVLSNDEITALYNE
jgi:hypothetical protein